MDKFDFNDDGTWDCYGDDGLLCTGSRRLSSGRFLGDDGLYVIEVCDDGDFVATYTDDDTGDESKSAEAFDTFKKAVEWCKHFESMLKQVTK